MTQSSFYADGEIYDTAVVESNDVPASVLPTTAPSGFYPNGGVYDELAPEGPVLAQMTSLRDQAAASQAAAGTSATNAHTSEVNAATSAGTATTQAGIATTKAGAASTSAGNAATSESNALSYKNAANTSATNAATSEGNALTYKNAANTSATNAGTSETNALSYLNQFKAVYYGSFASDPTTDPLGGARTAGDLYWNTTSSVLKAWNGSAWVVYNPVSVTTVFGRSGAVVAAANDYTFAQIGSKPTTISGYGITDTLTNTVFGRSGAVVAAANDYTFAQIGSKPTTLSGYGITDLVVTYNKAGSFTKQQSSTLATLTDAANIAWDVSAAQKAKVTLAGSRIMNAVTNAVEGTTYFLWVIQDATGSRVLTWTTTGAGSFDFGTIGAPTLTTAINKADLLCFEAVSIGGTLKLRYCGIQKGFS